MLLEIGNWSLKIGLPKPDKWFSNVRCSLRELTIHRQFGKNRLLSATLAKQGGRLASEARARQ